MNFNKTKIIIAAILIIILAGYTWYAINQAKDVLMEWSEPIREHKNN